MPSTRSAAVLGSSEKVELNDAVFAQPFNEPLVHACVIAELAARRQGTHATRTRGMVSGGGSKPWRQKGTGRARAGSSRSPIWKGGGTVFGPSPRHYVAKVNRKERKAALRCVLSAHAERESLRIVDAAAFSAPSTKQAAGLLSDSPAKRIVIALTEDEAAAAKSFRNIEHVAVRAVSDLAVADIVGAQILIASKSALTALEQRALPSRTAEVTV